LGFNQSGVLIKVLEPLAEAGISAFALSTYDTDYILVKNDLIAKTSMILSHLPDVEFL
jgi:hypothetical protein